MSNAPTTELTTVLTTEQPTQPSPETEVQPTTEVKNEIKTETTTESTTETTTESTTQSSGETVVLKSISISPSAPVSSSSRPAFSSLSDAVVMSYGQPSVQIAMRPSEHTTLSGYEVVGQKSGIYVLKQNDQNYVMTFDRNQLPTDQKQFRYMSVFSFGSDASDDQYGLWARSAVEKGYGLHDMSTGTGFYSRNELKHYVIFLFNEDFSHVGTVEMKNVR